MSEETTCLCLLPTICARGICIKCKRFYRAREKVIESTCYRLSMQVTCKCVFPIIRAGGFCVKCRKCHLETQNMALRAREIPYRFYCNGQLPWRFCEELMEQIELLVSDVYSLRPTALGQASVLFFFQETIYKQVYQLMLNSAPYKIELQAQDEKIFKTLQLERMKHQLQQD